jgi:hypothetical protein
VGPQWEVTFRGGLATGSAVPDGLTNTPLAGETFTMADGQTPTRAVSSWFFGDGASFLNSVLLARGLGTTRIEPADVPEWPVASRRGGMQFGGSVARHLKGGVWLEFAADVGLDPLGFDKDVQADVDATRADFEEAFKALATSASAVIASSTVTATSSFNPDGKRMILSAVVQYRGDGPKMRPYLLAGIGVASTFGNPATVSLTGTYGFTTPAQSVIEETDVMRVKYEASGSLVWLAGGGVMRDINRVSSYRIEARMLMSTTSLVGRLETEPSRVTSTPGGAIILNATTPGLQFSSVSSIRPSLSGPVHQGFEAFTGDGRAIQWVLSGAYVRKF